MLCFDSFDVASIITLISIAMAYADKKPHLKAGQKNKSQPPLRPSRWLEDQALLNSSPQECSSELLEAYCAPEIVQKCQDWSEERASQYNCSVTGLETLVPGKYEGITANFLSFATDIACPHFPVRAKEFEACTGGKIVFSEANNIYEDPANDLGTRTSRGSELYDGYLVIYSFTSEASSLGLVEPLNDRIRDDNHRLKYEDILPKVRAMGEYRKNGKTSIDTLMLDGDFFVPIIRIDLLEKFDLPLPNTWEEVAEYAKFFNGTDLNDDGDPNDFGFCHFPRLGSGYNDWWWSEAVYSTWASSDQTTGINQGFFFDEETMEPRIGEGFRRAAQIWKDLWTHGSDGCISSNFVDGRCAIGLAPPGCWKGVFVNSDGVARKDEAGKVIWRPTMKSGEYAEPYRFKPFGSTSVVDRQTGDFVPCRPDICPKAEKIPAQGHHGEDDRASVLPASPLAGSLINRAPFYWSGGFGTLIRKSAEEQKKDLMWDFFVFVNSPETSVRDVVQPSWLDSWRYSQLQPGENFIEAGWSIHSYTEHQSVMRWALSNDVNGAYNLRLPGVYKYTHEIVGNKMLKYIAGDVSLDQMADFIKKGWEDVTLSQGKLDQLKIYRASLGLEELSDFRLCNLHRELMDEKDPSICMKYDARSTRSALPSFLTLGVVLVLLVVIILYLEQKRRSADAVWKISSDELKFGTPPEILGRGTFGLVVLAEYRGTSVAVKRVIPPKDGTAAKRGSLTDAAQVLESAEPTSTLKLRRMSSNGNGGGTASVTVFDGRLAKRIAGSSITRNCVSTGGTASLANKMQSARTIMRPKAMGLIGRSDPYEKLKKDFIVEMRQLAKLRHPCIISVLGAVIRNVAEPMLVMECMEHGSLYDILHNGTICLDGSLVLPILQDIARGVRFLHAASTKVVHGDLKAANVLVDNRFRAKVADFGLSAKKQVGSVGTPYWMSPELLLCTAPNSTASDVYAFGVVLYEVYSRKEPYEGEDPGTVLQEVADPSINKRPPIPSGCPPLITSILKDCFLADPESRPTFEEIDLLIKRLDFGSIEAVDNIWGQQTNIDKNERLLHQVFPKHVAEALRDGRQAEADRTENATVFFSDIVGFTDLAAMLSPDLISDMLDRLYSRFDELTLKHDIFKMETIGDAYVAVTNLVKPQENDHAKRIAEFAIDAMQAAAETAVQTDDPSLGYVKMRVGMHSGPLIARVVGTRNPKYSVFGDTVNTAAVRPNQRSITIVPDTAFQRMESSSIAHHIQCSKRTADLLRQQYPDVKLISRGPISIKGKGQMETYFIGYETMSAMVCMEETAPTRKTVRITEAEETDTRKDDWDV